MNHDVARVYSVELDGIDARLIEVEVDMNIGLHEFNLVGLADKALNEARDRVSAALKNSDIKPPSKENRKITVNLAPADVKKTGSQYDLAIAVGYLLASQQIKPFNAKDKIFVGELALDGGLRPVSGALNIAEMVRRLGFKTIFISKTNANEAAAIGDIDVIPVGSLLEVIEVLENRKVIKPAIFSSDENVLINNPDFSEIKGQENAKRALMIAAAGGHHALMTGSPGVGKSFLARALAGVLPDLTHRESVEVTKIWSAAGFRLKGLVTSRPFRAPHQTTSVAALAGGGSSPRAGEISLAHCGVLFLDELPEFQSQALEALRQPIESGVIHVARAKRSIIFPAKFSLVAAMNPCPCGYYGDTEIACRCSPYEVLKYQKRISGPLLDRIDLQVKVAKVKLEELRKNSGVLMESAEMKARICDARNLQGKRFSKLSISTNAEMSSREAEQLVGLSSSGLDFIKNFDARGISPRAYYRILKVARTIADLAMSPMVHAEHVAEAYSYRMRDEN